MNLEQRARIKQCIEKLEGLLAWAKAYGETAESVRIENELPWGLIAWKPAAEMTRRK